jgi:hypothetical protein
MSVSNPRINNPSKIIKVSRCAKKLCKHNTEGHCKASPTELVEMGCFNKFTGGVKPVQVEVLENVFK